MLQASVEDSIHGSGRYEDATELPVLRALLRISDAVSRANFFDEVLEVIAEQSRAALGAASLAISRWEKERDALRILINVGDLAPHEQRWPDDDYYDVMPDSRINTLLRHGISYASSLDEPDCPEETRRALADVGKDSELAVPVMVADSMWGVIWAAGSGGRRFGDSDMLLLQAIAAHTAIAIGRAELWTTVWRYAFEDPLTGIANRRAIDQRMAEIDWEKGYFVALLCDLDGFKRFNDREGHPAGDRLLRAVAQELHRLTQAIEGAGTARLGGDEFCVLLPDASLASAQVFAIDATKAIRSVVDPTVSVSWGAAVAGPAITCGDELLAAADAALMEAKRQGPARFSTGVSTSVVPGGIDRRERDANELRGVERLPGVVVAILDEHRELTVPAALEMLALQVQQVIGSAAWAISECTNDCTTLRSLRSVDSVLSQESGLSVLTNLGPGYYDLDQYPASARAVAEGSAFVAAVDLEGSDPAEVALLSKFGYQAVLGVGVPAVQGCYLLEFFTHDGYQVLVEIAPLVQVLAAYCVSALSGTRLPRRPA